MICEKCGKNPATVIYTQILNGQKSSINICSACAAQESIFDNLGTLLSFSPNQYRGAVCPVCKTTLAEFTRAGRAGCKQCYSSFRPYAQSMLRKIHGTSAHCASEGEKTGFSQKDGTEELKKLLSDAIQTENFEEAARLRDRIREIEKEGK